MNFWAKKEVVDRIPFVLLRGVFVRSLRNQVNYMESPLFLETCNGGSRSMSTFSLDQKAGSVLVNNNE